MSHPSARTFSNVVGCLLLVTSSALAIGWAWTAFQAGAPEPDRIQHVSALRLSLSSSVERASKIEPDVVAGVIARATDRGTTLPQATESQDAAYAGVMNGQPAHRAIEKNAELIPVSLPPVSREPLAPGTAHDAPKIAIIIDDMGLAVRNSIWATRLPGPITLSYLPYATDVQGQVDAAAARGHEIMLHMPMEALDRHMYPGPGALTTQLDDATLKKNLMAMLNSFTGYRGVNNHMGSRMTSDPARMQTIIDAVDHRGVYFVDSWTSPRSVAYQVAASKGIPRARRDVFLDHYEGQGTVWAALAQAERMARRHGSAVVIGHPKVDTLSVLQAWLPAAIARGVKIVPASALIYDGPQTRDPVLQADIARGRVVQNVSTRINAIEPSAGPVR